MFDFDGSGDSAKNGGFADVGRRTSVQKRERFAG